MIDIFEVKVVFDGEKYILTDKLNGVICSAKYIEDVPEKLLFMAKESVSEALFNNDKLK